MQTKFRKFLTRLLQHSFGGSIEKAFLRNKIDAEAKIFACHIYLHGPSLRQTKSLLEDLGLKVAHSAIWYWFHRLGAEVGGSFVSTRRRRYLIADETRVKTQTDQIWIFAAVDPENREIVGVHVSKYRELVDLVQFLGKCLRYCKGKPILITDGDP